MQEDLRNWKYSTILALLLLIVVAGVGLGRTAVYAILRSDNPFLAATPLAELQPTAGAEARPAASVPSDAIMACMELTDVQYELIGRQQVLLEILR